MLMFIIFFSLISAISGLNSAGKYLNNTKNNLEFCSFFNNRAPTAQPGLKNCSWFSEYSCCLQQEIEATFGRVKPLIGASIECQRYTNYLMCYICSPNQNRFYQNERLTVCEPFCNSLFDACKGAFLKGNQIAELYPSGKEFCLSRRFLVGNSFNSDCFHFDVNLDIQSGGVKQERISTVSIFLPFVMIFMLALNDITRLLTDSFSISTNAFTAVSRRKTKSANSCTFAQCHHIYLIVLVLISFVQTTESHISTVETFSQLGNQISSFLTNYSNEVIKYSDMTKRFNNYELEKADGSKKIEEIKVQLGNYFSLKKLHVKNLSDQIAREYDDFLSNSIDSDNTSILSLSDLPKSMFLNSDYLNEYSLPPGAKWYNSKIGKEVLVNQSSVKIPREVERHDSDVINTVEWSSRLDKLFKEKSQPGVRWSYFASTNGVMRIFPGLQWKKNFLGQSEDYDPRVQSWFMGNKDGPTNVIIIIDTSFSMTDTGFERAKKVAITLLQSLTSRQRVSVIASSSVAWDTSGRKQEGNATVLGCNKERLLPATDRNQQQLTSAIQKLFGHGGSDHTSAFHKAFELLRNHQNFDENYLNCRSDILFVTDGKLDDTSLRCSPGFYRYTENNLKNHHPGYICHYDVDMLLNIISLLQNSLPGLKANIFTFLTSVESRSDDLLPGNVACNNDGTLSRVYKDRNIVEQLSPFFDYVRAREVVAGQVITGVYTSKIDDSVVLTISQSVFSQLTKRVIGVVAIDIPLSDVETLLATSAGEVEAFILNLDDGSAVVHPLSKRSYEIGQSSPSVLITDLEMEDNRYPAEFLNVTEMMLARRSGSYVITKDARHAYIHGGSLIWQTVKSVEYFFSNIPGTNFGVAVKIITPHHDSNLKPFKGSIIPSGVNYLHTLLKIPLANTIVDPEVQKLAMELNSTAVNVKYQGIDVSFAHSVIVPTPRAFCDPTAFQQQFNSTFLKSFDELNARSNKEDCVLTFQANRDMNITHDIEVSWKNIHLSSQSIVSVYVATPAGVIRHYPGMAVAAMKIRDPNRYTWYTEAVVNRGKISVSLNRFSLATTENVITLSRALFSGPPCTDSNPDDCGGELRAVMAVDVRLDEFVQKLKYAVGQLDQIPPCCFDEHSNSSCDARCYLMNDNGEVVLSFVDKLDLQPIYESYPFLFNVLQKRKLFQSKTFSKLQETCTDKTNGTEERITSQNIPYIQPFKRTRQCATRATRFHLNRKLLAETGNVFIRSFDDDPCHQGLFYLTPLNNTNLFLLAIVDHRQLESLQCKKMKHQMLKSVKSTEFETCAIHDVYYESQTYNLTCSRKRFIFLPCGYSSANSLSHLNIHYIHLNIQIMFSACMVASLLFM